MGGIFASGAVIDIALVLMLIESAILFARHWMTGRGLGPADMIPNLLAGMFLLLALRGALVQAWWGWTALCLAAALVAHATDVAWRWRTAAHTS